MPWPENEENPRVLIRKDEEKRKRNKVKVGERQRKKR
jgi:hypothetical protein